MYFLGRLGFLIGPFFRMILMNYWGVRYHMIEVLNKFILSSDEKPGSVYLTKVGLSAGE